MARQSASSQPIRSILLTARMMRPDTDEGGDEGVAAGLLDHAVAGVDEDHRHVRRRGRRHHVAGVLRVAR